MLNILTFIIGAYGGSVGVRAVRDKDKDFFDVINDDFNWAKSKVGAVKDKLSHKEEGTKAADSSSAKTED